MMPIRRRGFLSGAVAATSGLDARTWARAAQLPNDRIRIGLVGAGIRGRELLSHLLDPREIRGCEVTAVSEVDRVKLDESLNEARKRGQSPAGHQDFRSMLDLRHLDAVVIATPTHWHALATIWACQAGKDVYVENPVSHDLVEGRKMILTARKHQRIVQAGTQFRANEDLDQFVRSVGSGKTVGPINLIRVWSRMPRIPIVMRPGRAATESLDYDLWLGPSRTESYNPLHINFWRWFWQYGTGDLGEFLAHHVDLIQRVIDAGRGGRHTYPESVSGAGELIYSGGRETPDTFSFALRYPEVTLVWDHRAWPEQGYSVTVAFHGPGGTVELDGRSARVIDESGAVQLIPKVAIPSAAYRAEPSRGFTGKHLVNFLDAMRSRTRPTGEISEVEPGCVAYHLGNVVQRLNSRPRANVKSLSFDADGLSFPDNAEASRFLRREYRRPFVVPDKVD